MHMDHALVAVDLKVFLFNHLGQSTVAPVGISRGLEYPKQVA